MNTYEDVLYEVRDRVALITLNRPEYLNAFTAAMGRGLQQAVAAAIADESVRVIVLTGAGRGFCAGADMKLLQQISPDAKTGPSTAAAPLMSLFMASIPAAGLIEIPPESNVMPLPTKAR